MQAIRSLTSRGSKIIRTHAPSSSFRHVASTRLFSLSAFRSNEHTEPRAKKNDLTSTTAPQKLQVLYPALHITGFNRDTPEEVLIDAFKNFPGFKGFRKPESVATDAGFRPIFRYADFDTVEHALEALKATKKTPITPPPLRLNPWYFHPPSAASMGEKISTRDIPSACLSLGSHLEMKPVKDIVEKLPGYKFYHLDRLGRARVFFRTVEDATNAYNALRANQTPIPCRRIRVSPSKS